MHLSQLQDDVAPWVARNFKNQGSYQPLLGMTEELGELAHAHLKAEQGIRGTQEEHEADAKDALGDMLVYMADYANRRGFDLDDIIEETWAQVKLRDWTKNQATGVV